MEKWKQRWAGGLKPSCSRDCSSRSLHNAKKSCSAWWVRDQGASRGKGISKHPNKEHRNATALLKAVTTDCDKGQWSSTQGHIQIPTGRQQVAERDSQCDWNVYLPLTCLLTVHILILNIYHLFFHAVLWLLHPLSPLLQIMKVHRNIVSTEVMPNLGSKMHIEALL